MASRFAPSASMPRGGTAPSSRPATTSGSRFASGFCMVKGLANVHGAAIVAARADEPFASVDEAWRRSRVPVAALTRIAEADGFRPGLSLARREALWALKALRDEPLPLFAAASAREAQVVPEVDEPPALLRPMTAGGEVVEDYRHLSLSLRSHPVSFLREDLRRRQDRQLCRGDAGARRPLAGGGWPRAGPPAAGQRQGRDVHHARGRERHRQSRGLAEGLRAAPAHDPDRQP